MSEPTFISERISYLKKEDRLSIIITQHVEKKHERILLIRLLAWMLSGAVFIYYYLQADPASSMRTFMAITLAFWVYFFVRFTRVYLWRKFGKENILLEDNMLSLKRSYGTLGKATGYIIGNIKSFDILPPAKSQFGKLFSEGYLSTSGERLAFTYFGKSVIFGKQLKEKEVQELHRLIKSGMKRFGA